MGLSFGIGGYYSSELSTTSPVTVVRLPLAVVVRRLRFLSLLVVGDPSAVSTHSLLVQAAAAAAAAATEAVVASSAS